MFTTERWTPNLLGMKQKTTDNRTAIFASKIKVLITATVHASNDTAKRNNNKNSLNIPAFAVWTQHNDIGSREGTNRTVSEPNNNNNKTYTKFKYGNKAISSRE
jgi:hypothetical protein